MLTDDRREDDVPKLEFDRLEQDFLSLQHDYEILWARVERALNRLDAAGVQHGSTARILRGEEP